MSSKKTLLLTVAIATISGAGLLIVRYILHCVPNNELASIRPAPESATDSTVIRYLPLGDSYTIGESVQESERWPNQLVTALKQQGTDLQIVANPAVTGYTTQNLIDEELPLVAKLKPDFITVAIGVNDYVQGVNAQTFGSNLDYILASLQKQLPKPGNIVLLTIPDYGATPTGARYGSPAVSRQGIEAFNIILKQKAAAYSLPIADIYPASQQVSVDPGLIANDGLHPSGKQYAAWTKIVDDIIDAAGLLGIKSTP